MDDGCHRKRWVDEGHLDPIESHDSTLTIRSIPFAEPPPPINEAFVVRIDWQVPDDAAPGTHRVIFHGSEKEESNAELRAFLSESPSFEVTTP